MEFIFIALAVFAVIVRVGLWAIRTLDADKASKANRKPVAYTGPLYSNHGREIR